MTPNQGNLRMYVVCTCFVSLRAVLTSLLSSWATTGLCSFEAIMKIFKLAILIGAATLSGDCLLGSTVYNSRVNFLAALTSSTTVDFESVVPGAYSSSGGVSDSGVNFAGVTANGYYLYANNDCIYTANICLVGPSATDSTFGYLRVALPSGVNAIGADFAGYQGLVAPYEIRLSSGEVIQGNFTGAYFAFDFVGVVAPANIAYADFYINLSNGSNTAQASLLDNFTFGTSVPEPSTALLQGGMVLILAIHQVRRRGSTKRADKPQES